MDKQFKQQKEYKMKKTLLLTLALTTALSAEGGIKSGFYVGAQAGLSSMSGQTQLKSSAQEDAGGDPKYMDSHNLKSGISKSSISGGAFMGYAIKSGKLYAAAEVSAQLDNLKDKKESYNGEMSNPIKTEVSSTGALGASIHLGFAPNDNCVIYGILGVEARKFKVGFNDSSKAIEPVINKKYTSVAFTPGVGARFAVSENLSIRAEYKCAMHKSKTINASGINQIAANLPGALADQKVSMKVSPVVHSFNIGLVYSF